MPIAYADSTVAAAESTTVVIPSDVPVGALVLVVLDIYSSSGTLGATLASSGPTQPALVTASGIVNPLAWTAYSGGAVCWVGLWQIVAAAGDPGATLTLTQTGVNGFHQIGLGAWSGAVIDAAASGHTVNGGEVQSWTTGPTVTSSFNGDWAVRLGSDNNASAMQATPGTLRAGSTTRLGVGDSNGSIGPSGTTTAAGTWSNTAGTAPWGGFVLALRPSGAAAASGLLLAGVL